MKLDPSDIRQIAQTFADILSKRGFGKSEPFTSDKSRKSRSSDESASSVLNQLDEAIDSTFGQTIKRWQKMQRESLRGIKGSALKDAHNDYVERLKDIAKMASGANRKYFERYIKIIDDSIKAGTKRHKVQAIAARIMEYDIRAMRDRLKTNKEMNEEEKKILKEKIALAEKSLNQAKEYNSNLLEMHKDEIQARDQMLAGMLSTLKAGAWDAVTKTLGVVDSRLRNLRTSTEFVSAAMRGMSPEQMNEFRNATRKTTAVLGESADSVYGNTMRMMNEFGYFGADAASMTARAMNQLMAAGIKPSESGAENIMNRIGKAQIYEGLTRDEAVQLIQQEMGSEYFFMKSMGASDDQQEILLDQLVEARKSNKLLGLSAGYLEQQRQEQVNARYGSIISKIQQSAMSNAYISSLKSSMGPISGREEELLRKKLNNFISDTELSEYNATIGKRIGEFSSEYMRRSSAAAVTGDFSGVTGAIAVDELGRRVMDVESMAKEYTAAMQRRETEGAALRNMRDAQSQIDASRASLGPFEDAAKDVGVIIKGIGASPVGVLATAIGGAVIAGMSAALGSVLLRKLGSVFGGGGPGGGPLGGGWGKTRGRRTGGLGSILAGECGCDPCGGMGADIPERRGKRTRGRAAVRARRAGRGLSRAFSRHAGRAVPLVGTAIIAGNAYSDWSDIEEQVNTGQLTQAEAKEEKGGVVGALGGGLGGMAAGAAFGTMVAGPIGTVIGGLAGGLLGDFLGEKIGKAVADSETVDTMAKFSMLTNPATMPLAAASFFANNNPFSSNNASAMATGSVIDENGNVINVGDEQLSILKNIEQATTATASEVKKGNEQSQDRAIEFRNRSQYEQQQRQLAQSMAQTRIAAAGGQGATSIVSSRIANIDTDLAFG